MFLLKKEEELIKKGTILRITTILNLKELGFEGKAFLFLTGTEKFDSSLTIKKMSEMPNIFHISSMVGNFELLAMMVFKDISEVNEIVNSIRSFVGVSKVKVAISTDTFFPVKEEFVNIALEKELL